MFFVKINTTYIYTFTNFYIYIYLCVVYNINTLVIFVSQISKTIRSLAVVHEGERLLFLIPPT